MHDQARKRMNATCNNSHFSFGKNSSRQPIPNLLNESVFNDNHSVASIVQSSVISLSARDGSCWKFFQNSIWFVYLHHHSFARDNPGQHLASCNFFLLSASFEEKLCSSAGICRSFSGISSLNIGIHPFCLHIDVVYRGGIASEVRPHDYKEESFRWYPVTSPPRRLATSELATKERSRHQRTRHQAKSSRHQPPILRLVEESRMFGW